jgi:SAM-dependent methyltransferase
MSLPPEFLSRLRQLEEMYLTSEDPLRQSGFSGGAERWRREREPILEAFQNGGDLLDSCCANGYLLESLRNWGRTRGLEITPFGIDQGSKLIELARKRLSQFADHFDVANAWDWRPARRYDHVYALWDCVPEDYLTEFVGRLMARCVAPGGRLILGAYGSLSRHEQPFDVEAFLRSAGYCVSGTACAGNPPIARFAWIDSGTVK